MNSVYLKLNGKIMFTKNDTNPMGIETVMRAYGLDYSRFADKVERHKRECRLINVGVLECGVISIRPYEVDCTYEIDLNTGVMRAYASTERVCRIYRVAALESQAA